MQRLKLSKNKTLKIGELELKSCVTLAPMAGITDSVFRRLVRRYSQNSLLASEMLSSEAIKMNPDERLMFADSVEHPISLQISGHKPDIMSYAASYIEDKTDIIDINMGCPVGKIVKNNDGSALMKDPVQASKIILAVKKVVKKPVTVKFRLGWDCESKNYIEFARMAQDSGADAITVHGRTRTQMYGGSADWNAIGEIKNVVDIPVIGNGDINSVEKAIECLKISGVDGIAVGRGILYDPSLIYRIENYLDIGEFIPSPTISERIEMATWHCLKEIEFRGEQYGIPFMRKFFGWYIKDIRNAAKYRSILVTAATFNQVKEIFEEILENE